MQSNRITIYYTVGVSIREFFFIFKVSFLIIDLNILRRKQARKRKEIE